MPQGRPNDWRCRAGSRYLYICENGLVHYCSQQRGYPGVPIAEYTTADVKREFLTAKSCAPNCTIGCVHRISHIDHWRAPQTTHGVARRRCRGAGADTVSEAVKKTSCRAGQGRQFDCSELQEFLRC